MAVPIFIHIILIRTGFEFVSSVITAVIVVFSHDLPVLGCFSIPATITLRRFSIAVKLSHTVVCRISLHVDFSPKLDSRDCHFLLKGYFLCKQRQLLCHMGRNLLFYRKRLFCSSKNNFCLVLLRFWGVRYEM